MIVLQLGARKEDVIYFAQNDRLAPSQPSNMFFVVEEDVIGQLVVKDTDLRNVDIQLVFGLFGVPEVQ